MSLGYQQNVRQSQSAVLSPRLAKAIKLLKLSNLDLADFVEEELECNPLLERDIDMLTQEDAGTTTDLFSEASGPDDASDLDSDAFDNSQQDGLSVDPGTRPELDAAPSPELDDLHSEPFDEDIPQNSDQDRLDVGTEASRSRSCQEDYNLEACVPKEITLRDHLTEQLGLALTSPTKRLMGRYLIDLVDDAGYLPQDLGNAAKRLGASQTDVDLVLATLQTFDPPGVFARSLKECFAIQLRERNRYDPAMQALVENLALVPEGVPALRSVCGESDEDIADMIAELRSLDSKPGHKFGSVRLELLIPDVFVRRGHHHNWVVELNSEAFPSISLNQVYYRDFKGKMRNRNDKAYLANKWSDARWLVSSLERRANTILKVASEIVRQQHDFFSYGVEHLRPLNLKAVADAAGVHESTVSRVTNNKYMASNRGRFELKYFFKPSIASAVGETAHSAEAVRHRIKRLIDSEAQASVLSDDAIVELLRSSGIDIARRTVAKYRGKMGIPPSVERRRQKQAALGYVSSTTPLNSPDRTEAA
ncbi:RNA polymerase factor sigma-54 [Bradyrhizobium guangdongense]|uniref:RNA polymerase sigma-54 factor n=1 Tax=Bradyrhizobium guangdongense TaxID=1325090 RepID=A0A410VHW4_9BRAD|nr:RNA polymerase factor sigma-54 [Bradyrhizobium guangdongense]QAU43266.1 RNA polymerase sigma-54 factor [Bradyrhizobium guangdongense]QOZ64484.1 RNA polymerase sigma-54 factor [Bradyrhizobium guangdongense]GGI33851.1 RNA polymerase sigma-54 factor 2 [Bradyrhizobium guangdongense]